MTFRRLEQKLVGPKDFTVCFEIMWKFGPFVLRLKALVLLYETKY